jgi:hypothetical protein
LILEALARRYGPVPETYEADGVWLGYPEETEAPNLVSAPVVHEIPDAYLIESCEAYMVEYLLIEAWDDGGTELDEDEDRVAQILGRRAAARERIIPIHPQTTAGLQAKAQVAFLEMDALKGIEIEWETSIGRSAMVDLIAALR